MLKSMAHWYGNQLCVIDTETTGLDPNWHELIQIAIIPLDSNIEPRCDVVPFYISVIPAFPERADRKAMKVNQLKFADIGIRGFDREVAKDMLRDWIASLGLAVSKDGVPKRIMPLGQNYAFDMGFIKSWLGIEMYDEFFQYHYKDTMIATEFLNDRAAMHAETVPFPKTGLTYLCNLLNVTRERSHDALQDCLATAEVYRKLCQSGLMV